MANECCDTEIGGKCIMTVGDKTYEIMGELTVLPSGEERTGGATSNGELWTTTAAQPVRATLDFPNFCVASPRKFFDALRCKVNITFVETTRGIRHLFSKASIVGNPSMNLATGVVSGIEIVCAKRNYSEH